MHALQAPPDSIPGFIRQTHNLENRAQLVLFLCVCVICELAMVLGVSKIMAWIALFVFGMCAFSFQALMLGFSIMCVRLFGLGKYDYCALYPIIQHLFSKGDTDKLQQYLLRPPIAHTK